MTEKIESDWPGTNGNRGRWSNDRGTLNLISPEVVRQAIATVESGRVIGCSRPLTALDVLRPSAAFRHEMMYAGKKIAQGKVVNPNSPHMSASDEFFVRVHGLMNTHVDALCHVGWAGQGTNGLPFEQMVTMEGAHSADITAAMPVVTRGYLADIPKFRQEAFVPPGEAIRVDELQQVTAGLQSGDALLVRTGRWQVPIEISDDRSGDIHGRFAGLHVDCMDYLGELGVSLLGSDGPCDTYPSPINNCPSPIHVLALAYWGIHLIHNMDLDMLAQACRESNRPTFLFSIAPLYIQGGTGSPITPIAIF